MNLIYIIEKYKKFLFFIFSAIFLINIFYNQNVYGDNKTNKISNDTLNTVLYLELNGGFKKNELIKIIITNSKGTKEIFNDYFKEESINSRIIVTKILKNQMSRIKIISNSRKKNLEYGILIRKINQVWNCISYNENGNLRVLFGDEFIGSD